MTTDTPDNQRNKITLRQPEIQSAPQLPLKILVLAELTPRDLHTSVSPSVLRRMSIDKTNFSEIMTQLNSRVMLEVSNRLAETPKTLVVELPLTDLKSFRPEAIAEQVPSLRNLLELRSLVVQLRDHQISRQDFWQQLRQLPGQTEFVERMEQALSAPGQTRVTPPPPQTPPTPLPSRKPPPGGKEETLDALLEMVAAPETVPAPLPRPADSLLDQVLSLLTATEPADESLQPRATQAVIADLDATISAQVNTILHHPEFRRLEAVWRGLKFLVDRTDFRENIQLEVLSVSKAGLRATFPERVFQPEYEGVSAEPVSLIIADYEFDSSLQDIELLQELAQQVEMLQVPLIAAIGPAFFGIDSVEALHRLPSFPTYFERPEYIKWNAFRQSEPSRWITLTFNRFLLRLPYGPEGERVKAFDLQESMTSSPLPYLWGSPVWAMASLITASFARTGWPAEITGIRSGGAVENLPVRAYPFGGSEVALPLETVISEQTEQDLTHNGIVVFTCRLNTDAALILSAPTTHRPERYADAATTADSWLRATLSYQLVASQIMHAIQHLYGEIVPGNTPEGIKSDFTQALRSYLATTGALAADAVRVEVMPSAERPGTDNLLLHIRPGQKVLGGRAVLELQMRIRQ